MHTVTHVRRFAAVLVLAATAGQAATAATPTRPPEDEVRKGEYLAAAAHCAACHTSREDRPYAGNLAIPSRFGTMYSSNITPDPKTGIGAWTEAEFTAALRDGRGRHGSYLYPSMPYTAFTLLADDDVHALWLYMRSLRPIAEPSKPNTMTFPFGIRSGIAAWQALYFKPHRYATDPTRSASWNRGAYLVEGLGHCGACHTPKGLAMADRPDRPLQGAPTGDGWFAPNIGGGRFSGIADWSAAQIVAYLKTGHNEKNVAAVGPMLATIARGTDALSDADLQAIAEFLKNQPAAAPDAAPKAVAIDADRRNAGSAVYQANCASCHGQDGRGVDGIAPALAGNTSVTARGAENVVHAVLSGFVPSGRWGAMPSFAALLDSQQIADVANHVRTSWGQQGSANVTVSAVNRLRDAVEPADPRIEQALLCPPVAAAELDPVTEHDLASLARTRDARAPAAATLVRQYRQRHPAVERGEVVNVLAGAYCRDLMAVGQGSAADKQSRVIDFMGRVAAAQAGPGR